MKRREFNRLLSFLGISFFVPNIFSINFNKRKQSESMSIDPISAIGAARTALSLINNFSSTNTSPINAILRYQMGMFDQVSLQLDNIQKSLLEINTKINSIPDEINKKLIEFKLIETITSIRANVNRYNNTILKVIESNPDVLKNKFILSEIEDIRDSISRDIFTLRELPDSNGPEACMIAPLAMCLDVAVRINLGYDSNSIKVIVQDYKKWFETILSKEEGALFDYQRIAIEKHDKLLDEFKDVELAKRYNLLSYKLKGEQLETMVDDPTVLFLELPRRWMSKWFTFDKNNTTREGDKLVNVISGIYRQLIKIKNVFNSELQVNLIQIKKSLKMVACTRSEKKLAMPKRGHFCYTYYWGNTTLNPKKLTHEIIEKIVETESNVWTEDQLKRAEIIKTVSEVNFERAKLSLCSMAITVAQNNLNRIDEYLKLL